MPVEKPQNRGIMTNRLDASAIYALASPCDEPRRPDLHISLPVVYNLPHHRKGEGYMGGSVIQDKRTGKWCIQVYQDGNRYRIYNHPVSREPFLSEKSAKKQLSKIQTEIDEHTFNPKAWLPDSPLGTHEYCKRWLVTVAATVLPKTLEHCYKPAVRYHIGPYFEAKDIRNIRYNDLLQFKLHLAEKGLSEKSIYNYVGTLKKILHDAWRNEDIAAVPPFPTLSMSLPEIVYLTREQQDTLIEAMPVYHRPIFKFGMEYGLRNQELRALMKDCITDDSIIIRRTWTYHRDREVLRETTKTGQKGRRILGLTWHAREILRSVHPHLSDFVFVKRSGVPYRNQDLNEIWHEAEKATGIKCRLQNALRHSLGCQLLDMGVDEGIVQQIYGHTDRKMTRRYAKRSVMTVTEALEKRGKIIKLRKEQS